jgi:hypothetical protein
MSKSRKYRSIFEFLTSKASDIIALGDLDWPDLFFDIWQAIFGQKMTNFHFFTAVLVTFELI